MRRLGRVLVLLAAMALSLVGATRAAAAAAPGDGGLEARLLARVNALRATEGVGPLTEDADLTAKARDWAAHMGATDVLAHSRLEDGVHLNWVMLGENVGVGHDVDQVQDAFERSPHHRENEVEPAFQRVGTGVAMVDGKLWISQVFAELAPAGAAGAVVAAAPATPATTVARPAPPRPTTTTRPAAPPTTIPSTVAPTIAPPPPVTEVIATDPAPEVAIEVPTTTPAAPPPPVHAAALVAAGRTSTEPTPSLALLAASLVSLLVVGGAAGVAALRGPSRRR